MDSHYTPYSAKLARALEIHFDFESPSAGLVYAPHLPGPVRKLDGEATTRSQLVLLWQPLIGVLVDGYRFERIREERKYELNGETKEE